VTIKINLVGNEFDKLKDMYYLIRSSGCLLSLPVVMCVLGSVLSSYCYTVTGMTQNTKKFSY